MSELPLVTFGLIAYQQERFIRAAVASAFAQTYSPLEIILSDDASPDRTFAILQEMAATYRGPHRIVLNRNEPNRGLTGNVNRIMELAHGELVFLAAGDDVSLPDRVRLTVEEWIRRGRPRGSLSTSFSEIDETGQPLAATVPKPASPSSSLTAWIRAPHVLVNGASHAFHPDLFRVFGPLAESRLSEDNPLAVRALALDGLFFLDVPLVKYRRHSANLAGFVEQKTTLSAALAVEARRHLLWVDVLEQVLRDLEHPAFAEKFGAPEIRRARTACLAEIRRRRLVAEWQKCGNGTVSWDLVARAWQFPPFPGIGLRLLVRRLWPGLHRFLAARNELRWGKP